jgi:hypothetical protein
MLILYFSIIWNQRCSSGVFGVVHHRRRPVGQRPVDDVAVPGDPTNVSAAPVQIRIRLEVEDGVVGVGHLGQIAASGVQDALRLARGARGVHHIEGVLGVEGLRRVLGRLFVDDVVPPYVAALGDLGVLAGAPHHQHGAHIGTLLQRLVDRRLEG